MPRRAPWQSPHCNLPRMMMLSVVSAAESFPEPKHKVLDQKLIDPGKEKQNNLPSKRL